MSALENKLDALKRFIAQKGQGGVVVAFSGGVDSSTLAAVAHGVLGERSVAVIAKSPTYTSEEFVDAQKTAKDIGIKLFVVETNELQNPDFAKNPENRCYFCKKELLQTLLEFAHKLGFKAVFEGTNSSDLSDHRPGFEAVQETAGVFSPLMVNGFSKQEIRSVAKQLGLSVHDKPALACLASRIPFGELITAQKLRRVEEAERAVKAIVPVKQLRVRDHGGLARIEIGRSERGLFCDPTVQDKVAGALKELGFYYVTFDLEGYRSGSMLKTLENKS
jgi:pyridinium-3,5-biscarboxylic acid mononucleotide sulfurtransferase